MIDLGIKTKYTIRYSTDFKRSYKKVKKQGKDINKLKTVLRKLANLEELEEKYQNHMLNNSKHYKNCGECHLEPDWLLIYRYQNKELILLLVVTGSHSDLF